MTEPADCPVCGSDLVRRARQQPWCASCEWNLAAWSDWDGRPLRGQRRRRRERAFRLDEELRAAFTGALPSRTGASSAQVLLAAASVVLFGADLALLAFGVLVMARGDAVSILVGLVPVLVALECRPRFSRLTREERKDLVEDATELRRLVDEVATALGAPRIRYLLLTDEVNAACALVGLRRRPALWIGLPLWGALSPSGRLALLGHELGHLVNGDPTRQLLGQPATTTFGRLAYFFDPRHRDLVHANEVIELLVRGLKAPVYLIFRLLHLGIWRIAARDHQRAELYADALGARLGGSAGLIELSQILVFERPVLDALRRSVRHGATGPGQWQPAVAATIAALSGEERVFGQLSRRLETDAYASHPPSGLRLALARSWPTSTGLLPADAVQMATVDRQLAPHWLTTRRQLELA